MLFQRLVLYYADECNLTSRTHIFPSFAGNTERNRTQTAGARGKTVFRCETTEIMVRGATSRVILLVNSPCALQQKTVIKMFVLGSYLGEDNKGNKIRRQVDIIIYQR